MPRVINNHAVFHSAPKPILEKPNPQESTLPKRVTDTKSKEGVDHALNLFGMTLTGIDPLLISEAKFDIEVPLKEGRRNFIGLGKDARLKIKEGSKARLSIEIIRNEHNALVLKALRLLFNENIIIKNPASSLQQKSENSRFSRAVKDALARVAIKEITIDALGNVSVDGKIKALRIIKKSLPEDITKIDLPKLDEAFLHAMGLLDSDTKIPASKKSTIDDTIDVNKILRKLGAITEEGHFSISIKGDSSHMSFLSKTNFFKGPRAPLDMSFSGQLQAKKSGDISFSINGENSFISCSLGNFRPDIKAVVQNIGGNKTIINYDAKVSGQGNAFHMDMYSRQAVTDILPRRRMTDYIKQENARGESDYNASVGAQTIDIEAGVKGLAHVNQGIEKASLDASLTMKVHGPYTRSLERGVALDGYVGGNISLNNVHYEKNTGLRQGYGTADFSINPAERTLEKFPEIKPISFPYEISLAPNGKGRIKPPNYGLARLIKPLRNFEGHSERVNGSLTKGPLYPIGSPQYFSHVEHITGAKLREAKNVKLLIDGINSMPERIKIIENAQKYICFQTLVFKDDESGWHYAKALVDAARRGVRVYGIVDSLGNIESLKDLEERHPIYQYLIENGVRLEIYNGFLEQGLRTIFKLTKKYPAVFKVSNPTSLTSVAEMLRFIERVIEVTKDGSSGLTGNERSELKIAIHTMFDGKEGVSPEISLNELWDVLVDKTATFEELLSLTKRMGRASYRWHEKYLIADGEAAVVGGMNVATEYLQGGSDKMVEINDKVQPTWHDVDVLLKGDVVVDAYRSFRRNWFHVALERLDLGPKINKIKNMGVSDYAVSIIQHRPLEDGDHNVVNYLLYNLRTLKSGERAWFETAYFLPRGVMKVLKDEMVLAARRGVDVRIITNSETTSDFGPLVESSIFDVRDLLEAGARIFYRNDERMVHAKVTVFGDKLTMVGSWNMDNRSASHDSEDIACIFNHEINQEMTDALVKDMMDHSRELSLKAVQNQKISKEIYSAAMLLAAEMV